MSDFVVYPAIDLHRGKVVRLRQGDLNARTDYGDSPLKVAQQWLLAGATWLHVVNLDGAFGLADAENRAALRSILSLPAKVQFGGGVRAVEDVAKLLEMGVSRVVLGTVAVERPEVVRRALAEFGTESVAVGIDARGGQVRIRGWEHNTSLTPLALAKQMARLGVRTIIFTNIARDGVEAGLDVETARSLAETTGLQVIASGGVAGLADVCRARAAGLAGVIVGRALYEGKLVLAEAVQC